MEYKVVEVKWSRDGNFVGAPPIQNYQLEMTNVLNSYADDGWVLTDIHHEVDDSLRFSIITMQKA